MSRILETANGTTTITTDYEIEIDALFELDKLTNEQRVEYEKVKSFIALHGTIILINIEVEIDEGIASFRNIEDFISEKTSQTIDPTSIPKILMDEFESTAEFYAEENGLSSFLDW